MSMHTHILKINERVIVMEIAEVNGDIKCTLKDPSIPHGMPSRPSDYEYNFIYDWYARVVEDAASKDKCLHVFDPQYVLTS